MARPALPFQRKIFWGFLLAGLLVICSGVAAALQERQAADARAWVSHTRQVLYNLARLRADGMQIELLTQNFRLTGNPQSLDERERVIGSRSLLMTRTGELISDNARQVRRWEELSRVLAQRLALARQIDYLTKNEGPQAAQDFVARAPLQESRNRMYDLLTQMEDEENHLLERRLAYEQLASRQLSIASAALAILLFGLLAANYWIVRRQSDLLEQRVQERTAQVSALNIELEAHVKTLEHLSRALRTLSAGNRSMLHAGSEADLLANSCTAIVSAGGYRTACIWYRSDDGLLKPVAQSGLPGGLPALQRIAQAGGNDPSGATAVAVAVRTGKPQRVQRLQDQPSYQAWRTEVALFGDALACPLLVDGQIIGALAIYTAREDGFSNDEVELLTECSDDLAFGIASLRNRASGQESLQSLHRVTFFDRVTGLPNEARLAQQIDEQLQRVGTPAPGFALIQANVERLRDINDALGFQQGDELLRQFGLRLQEWAPSDAIVARLRGDEFALLLPAYTVAKALGLVGPLLALLSRPFLVAGLSLDVGSRLGIAVHPEHGGSVSELLHHLDIAVSLARHRSQSWAVYEPASARSRSERLALLGDLRRAIESGELRLYLQPKVDMSTGELAGAEALVRWQHPDRGLIPPSNFIVLAEQTTLIRPLTEWVIEHSLRWQLEWQRQGLPMVPIAVNLSASSLRDETIVEHVQRIRESVGAQDNVLELELTESMLMEDADHALHILNLLREDSITLYVDDFGTGYSSLSYLQKLPVDYIKIDRSFVKDMVESKDSAVIVRSTIDLTHDLGRKVVAEGVETWAHWERLAQYGCDVAQGFFVSAPMPAEEFAGWMQVYRPAFR